MGELLFPSAKLFEHWVDYLLHFLSVKAGNLHQLQMSATERALTFYGTAELEMAICSAFCYLDSSLEIVSTKICKERENG